VTSIPETPKDLFSVQSTDYAKFRPRYPEDLFLYLVSLTNENRLAWDCGTGNGQAAVELAEYFDSVIATDPSEKQLLNAEKNPKVIYKKASAEESPLEARSADLVTVAQAFHWFKHDEFFREVKRVLKPEGILGIWTYNLCQVTPAVDAVVQHFYQDILGPYWEKERKLVEEGYRKSAFPFKEVKPPQFAMEANWSIEHFIGYLGTWSALQTYIKKNGENPLEATALELRKAWGEDESRLIRWELSLRVGMV
jgi:SAM-dependent methyltransferase